MNYIGIDGKVYDNRYLIHFNPYHDKLGRFTSSGISSVGATRLLNSNSKKRDKLFAKEMRANYKVQKEKEKNKKLVKKIISKKSKTETKVKGPGGKTMNSVELSKSEARKIEKGMIRVKKAEADQKRYRSYKDLTQRVNSASIDNLQYAGFNVYERDIVRNTQKGKDFTALMLGDTPSRRIKRYQDRYGKYYDGQTPSTIASKRYIVTRRK